jgi:hypothetical protein
MTSDRTAFPGRLPNPTEGGNTRVKAFQAFAARRIASGRFVGPLAPAMKPGGVPTSYSMRDE